VESNPATCLSKVNRLLCAENAQSMFVTLFFGVLDPASGEVTYCNAGHNVPLVLRRDGAIEQLENTWCIIAGVDAGATYTEQRVQLHTGDRLLLYTDGVTEAAGKDDEMFGEKRLNDFLRSSTSSVSNTLLTELIATVATFSGPKQTDDITTLLLEYRGS
jgi:phosphoserine phosphatase RsbU/P